MGLVPSFGPPGVDCDAGWLMAFPGSSLQMFPQSGDLPKSKTSMRVVFSGETKWHQYLGILNLQTFEHYPWVEHTSRSCIQSDPSHPKLPDTSGCLSPPPGTCKSCNAFNFEDFLCRLSRNQSHHAPGRARWFFPLLTGDFASPSQVASKQASKLSSDVFFPIWLLLPKVCGVWPASFFPFAFKQYQI